VVSVARPSGAPGVWRETSRHTHRWLVGKIDGPLSEGVCKGCGARRDFTERSKHSHNPKVRPLESLGGTWLPRGVGAFAEPQEVKMSNLSDDDERQAQHIACSHLIRGCESAVSELLYGMSEADEGSPAMKRAREILVRVISSWRDTLKALKTAEEAAS